MTESHQISPKQIKFVQAFLETHNQTKAAIAAGYSERSAENQGRRLMGNAGIKAMIDEAHIKSAERSAVTVDSLTEMHMLVYRYAMEGQPTVDRYGKPGPVMRQLPAANAAAQGIAKLHGLAIDKVDNTHKSLDNMSEAELKAELTRGDEMKAKLTRIH